MRISLFGGTHATHHYQCNKISTIPKKKPPQLPTERASRGVQHNIKTTPVLEYASTVWDPSPDPTNTFD